MGRKKANQQNNNKTKFIMKGNPLCRFKNQTVIDFQVQKKNEYYKKAAGKPLFPAFNFDRKYYTPTFLLPRIQILKQQEYLVIHNQKVEQSIKELQIDQIMVPKPRSKNKYCGVCRAYYQQYLDHVESEDHLKCLEKSCFQKHISNMCFKFRQNNVQTQMSMMQKFISIQTKINEDQNSTQSLIEQKKQQTGEIVQIVLSL